ncbi:MAG: hypothetical protein QM764_20670 [Chitinophagaceae bacterium]
MNQFFKIPTNIKWKEVITLVGPTLIFLGILRLWVYYYAFNVDIISYLNFSEILTSFLQINIIVGLLCFPGILFLLTIVYCLFQKKWPKKALFIAISFGVVLGITFSFIFVYSNGSAGLNIAKQYFLGTFISIVIVVLFYFWQMVSKERSFIPNSLWLALLGILIFVLITLCISFNEISNTKFNKLYIGTVVELEKGEKILSTETDYMAGKTNSFIYIFHQNKQVTDIIPMEQIKIINLKRTIFYFDELRH